MPLYITNAPTDGTKSTYSSSALGIIIGAAATDVFTISGSATKTIRITNMSITVTTTSNSGTVFNLSAIRRSSLDTGGTSSTLINVPHDISNAAGTAVVKAYTANPTVGATVGAFRSLRYAVPSGNQIDVVSWTLGNRPAQSIVLRGVNDLLALSFNGTQPAGGVFSADVEWTEE